MIQGTCKRVHIPRNSSSSSVILAVSLPEHSMAKQMYKMQDLAPTFSTAVRSIINLEMARCNCGNLARTTGRVGALTRRRCGALLLLAPSVMTSRGRAAAVRCGWVSRIYKGNLCQFIIGWHDKLLCSLLCTHVQNDMPMGAASCREPGRDPNAGA